MGAVNEFVSRLYEELDYRHEISSIELNSQISTTKMAVNKLFWVWKSTNTIQDSWEICQVHLENCFSA